MYPSCTQQGECRKIVKVQEQKADMFEKEQLKVNLKLGGFPFFVLQAIH